MKLKCVLCMLFALSIDNILAKTRAKYELNYPSGVDVCEDERSLAFVDTSGLEVVHYNASIAILKGQLMFHQTLEPATMLELVISQEDEGRYKTIATHEICDICKEMEQRDVGTVYSPYFRHIDTPNCPVPPGTYNINDMVADFADIPINSFMVGKYLITFNWATLRKDEQGHKCNAETTFLGCFTFAVAID